MDWLKEMLNEARVEVQAREIWSMMGTSQPIQESVLCMVERQEMVAADMMMERRKTDRLFKNDFFVRHFIISLIYCTFVYFPT